MALSDMSAAQLKQEGAKWGLSGSGKDLAERIETHVGVVRDALNALDHADLQNLADQLGVAHDPIQTRFDIIESILLNGVDLDQVVPAATEPDLKKKERDVTPEGTVWIGRYHVDVGSPEYDELIGRGMQPGPPPDDAVKKA